MRNVSSAVIAWSSSDSTIISVSPEGLAIAQQASGSATITAALTGMGAPGQVSIVLTAAPRVLESISLSPLDASVTVTGNQTYTATGNYSDSTTADLTGTATWAVVNNINGSGGQATNIGASVTATAEGIVKVTATDTTSTPNVTGATYLNIGLTAISVSPTNPSVPKGTQQQFTATGTFTGPSLDVTNSVVWASQDTTIAEITSGLPACGSCPNGGLATAHELGTSNITASSGAVNSNTAVLTVIDPVITSVVISPTGGCNSGGVPRGNSCQFTAMAIFSDQSNATVTDSAMWISDKPNCAAIDATALATTLSSVSNPCTANITATYSSVTSNPPTALTVTAHALNSISIVPADPVQPKGAAEQFEVRANYSDGTVTVSNGANGPSWYSYDNSIATIDSSSGLASTTNSVTGTVNIGAFYNGFNTSTTFTVTASQLQSIAVTPVGRVPLTPDDGSTTIPVAGTQQFKATGTYTDTSAQDITSVVNWSSSIPAIATITDPNSPGKATGVAAGTLTMGITVTDPNSSITGSASLTVKAINSISVSPATATVIPGGTRQFTATANYGGSTQPLTAFGPAWSSNHTNFATVAQTGLATAISAGSATISAQLGSGSCTGVNCGALTVGQAVLQSITVSCDPHNPCTGSGQPLLSLGQNEQMIATGHYSDGSNQDLTTKATWASSIPTVATINTTGFLMTKHLGTTNITATCTSGGACPGATSTVQGTMQLTVTF